MNTSTIAVIHTWNSGKRKKKKNGLTAAVSGHTTAVWYHHLKQKATVKCFVITRWQADGAARTGQPSTATKIKKHIRKQKGITELATFSRTQVPINQQVPSGIFHIPAVVPDKPSHDSASWGSSLISVINLTQGKFQNILHNAAHLLGLDIAHYFRRKQI